MPVGTADGATAVTRAGKRQGERERGTPPNFESGTDAESANEAFFFFCRSELLTAETSLGLTRDELLLYLLHCRGYHPKHHGSLMGEKAARERLFLTRSEWLKATEGLEARGLILRWPSAPTTRPLTVVGCPARPLTPYRPSEGESPALLDAHCYEHNKDHELIKMPWSLIDGDQTLAPCLGYTEARDEVLVLLALYLVADNKGDIPAGFARVQQGEVKHRLVTLLPGLGDSAIEDALAGLAGSELVIVGEGEGTRPLRLFHPMR